MFYFLYSTLITLLFLALEAVHAMGANLTAWRQHRRQKRFLIYQDGGVIKVRLHSQKKPFLTLI